MVIHFNIIYSYNILFLFFFFFVMKRGRFGGAAKTFGFGGALPHRAHA